MKKRKVVKFAKYKVENVEHYLTCPDCEGQEMRILNPNTIVCIYCDVIIEPALTDNVVQFKGFKK